MNTNHGIAPRYRSWAGYFTLVKYPRKQREYWQNLQHETVLLFNKKQCGSIQNKTYKRMFNRLDKYQTRCNRGRLCG